MKSFTPTRLILSFALLCTLFICALTLRGPQPALTILHYGKPVANVVVEDPLSNNRWTTDANGTLFSSFRNQLPKVMNIPTPDGQISTFSLESNGHTTIDMHDRTTTLTTVRREFGLFRATNQTTQFAFTDEERAAINRGEITFQEASARLLGEASASE